MGYIENIEIEKLKENLLTDEIELRRVYNAKRNPYQIRSVDHSMVESFVADKWEDYTSPLKTKTKLRKLKSHDVRFEDDVWCQLYELGYRHLNFDRNFKLPYGPDSKEKQQIDIIAINDENILLVECRSSSNPNKAPSYKNEFDALGKKLYGFSKVLKQAFGEKKIKYIFATRNLRIDTNSTDIERLVKAGGFYYNDKTHEYVNSLIEKYKEAAHYQFTGLVFKGLSITKSKIEIPAIKGSMGGKVYYMFSIEPHQLLRMGFVLHRTSANENEMPTYQRLLVPSRLKGIRKFITDGGFFPNSIILNFGKKNDRSILEFQSAGRAQDSQAQHGVLKIPNIYAIAYIIDGQHRVYGYAGTPYKESNTIPVVAFDGLESTEQLEIFMGINENQKAVSATLRITLEEDLYWDSERADSRIKALRSSIIQQLSDSQGPLYNKIAIGEDKALLSANPFAQALSKTSLLPNVKGNKYDDNTSAYSLYDVHNQNHHDEMGKAKKRVVAFLNKCYDFAEENYQDVIEDDQGFIISNRGTFAFISLVSSLNEFVTKLGHVSSKSTPEIRFEAINKYLSAFFRNLKSLPSEKQIELKKKLGQGAETIWFRTFQSLVNKSFPAYEPVELVDWKERQDKSLQDEARDISHNIERYIKKVVLGNLERLFGDSWDLEIGAIQRDCEKRAKEEMERRYKEGLGRKNIPWTDQFFISDYKTIIEKYWTKRPSNEPNDYVTFEKVFSIDIGLGFNSKAEKLKWLSLFSSYRNSLAHGGSKEQGLNKDEVDTLKQIQRELNTANA